MVPTCLRPERLERGDPCWLLKQRQMGTYGVQMKEVLSWLVCWALRACTSDFYPGLATQVSSVQNIVSSPHTFWVPIAQQPGQAVVPKCLTLNICLCLRHSNSSNSYRFYLFSRIITSYLIQFTFVLCFTLLSGDRNLFGKGIGTK